MPLAMRMSDQGRALLTKREGVRLKAYQDTVGVWTIGIGHTSAAGEPKVTAGLTITAAQCDEIFRRDLVTYENAVNKAVARPLTQNQYDACVSLCYNIGTGGFARSTVVKRINAGDMAGAAQAFMNWSKPPEIMGRRKTEVAQFLTPYKDLAAQTSAAKPKPPDIHKSVTPAPADKTGGNVGGLIAGAVVTGSTVVVAKQTSEKGADTSQIAIVVGCGLVIALAAFFVIRQWRKS